jgi:hypothetical protein
VGLALVAPVTLIEKHAVEIPLIKTLESICGVQHREPVLPRLPLAPRPTMTTAKSNLFLVAVALFVSGMLLGIAPVRADELPADTNKIESLTPERARKLATEFSGVSVAVGIGGNSPANPRPRSGFGVTESRCLPLNGLKSIDKETAKELAGYSRGPLLLDGLTTLDADTATALVEFKGGYLFLRGLTTLDADTATALAKFKHRLYLDGLTTLDAETAKGFANVMFLNLAGLSALDARTAKVLAANPKWDGQLPSLTRLDADTAQALAEFKSAAFLLSLSGLNTLDVATANALAAAKRWSGRLPSLTSLDAATAKVLAASPKWDGQLPKITTLDTPDSVVVAKALATRKGPLSLPSLKKISPKTLSALIEKRDVEIPLVATLEFIAEPDGSETDDFIIPAWLEERQRSGRPK